MRWLWRHNTALEPTVSRLSVGIRGCLRRLNLAVIYRIDDQERQVVVIVILIY